jgi:hypothetical protein
MIWAGCFEKLLEVIRRLSCLVFKVTLGGGNELLVRVTSVHIVVTFVATGGDHDSLGPSHWPPLCTLVGCLGWRPPPLDRRLGPPS